MKKYILALVLGIGIVLRGQLVYAQLVDENVPEDEELIMPEDEELIMPKQLDKYISPDTDENKENKPKVAKQRKCGKNCSYELDNKGMMIIKPINSEEKAYIREGAFADRQDFTRAKIEEGIVSIGAEAFRDTRLIEIDFPSTLTSIGENVFGWTRLEKINMDTESSTQAVDQDILTCPTLMKLITPEQLKYFIARGASVNAKSRYGDTPLMYATGNTPEVFEILLEHGANVENRNFLGHSPLTYAASDGNPQIVELLLKYGADINAKSTSGATSLMKLIRFYGTPQKVEMLIKYGADVNIRDKEGKTALMWAAIDNKNPQVLETLIKHGADINAKDENGATALMHACKESSNPAVIHTLLDNGATIQDAEKLTELLAKNSDIKKNQDYWDLRDRISGEIEE